MTAPFLNWVRTGFLAHLRSKPIQGGAIPPDASSRLWRPTGIVPGDFLHKGTAVRAMCRVEKRQDTRMLLRVTAEMGKVSLLRLARGTPGHLELDDRLVPFRVARVVLPQIEVFTFPDQARPVLREWLRVPASFAVRLRRQGSTGLWISGQGVDLSAGGFCFSLTPPYVPRQGDAYDIDMLLDLPRDGEERAQLDAHVRWVRGEGNDIYVGAETSQVAQKRLLTNVATQWQRALTRSPEDYLLI